MQANPRDFIKPLITKNKDILKIISPNLKDNNFDPELYRVYFSRTENGPICGVYNLTEDQAKIVSSRFINNPQIEYIDLLKDMPGVLYADEAKPLKFM